VLYVAIDRLLLYQLLLAQQRHVGLVWLRDEKLRPPAAPGAPGLQLCLRTRSPVNIWKKRCAEPRLPPRLVLVAASVLGHVWHLQRRRERPEVWTELVKNARCCKAAWAC
jgi:hypothetical protein